MLSLMTTSVFFTVMSVRACATLHRDTIGRVLHAPLVVEAREHLDAERARAARVGRVVALAARVGERGARAVVEVHAALVPLVAFELGAGVHQGLV